MTNTRWPVLPSDTWRDTYPTLHMWTQIVGKIALALTPRTNHFWNVALHLTSRGLTTPLMYYHDRAFTITFDFVEHELLIETSDGATEIISLEPRTVADFYKLLMSTLHGMNIDVRIWTMPQEVPNPIKFEKDVTHRSYDPVAVNTFWQMLLAMKPVFDAFRAKFIGKCSPVHFFWGSFDLAVTRFSGRRALERPGADPITRESYSHEVISHGFWPGSGAMPDPAFYAYAAPEPAGLKTVSVRPAAASYSSEFSEFLLPYEAVRTAHSPEAELTAFFTSTYNVAADLAKWTRIELERS
jgi:uncharacterized protein DUF5996